MKLYNTGICTLVLAAVSQSAVAVPFAFEARSMGMGGVGVATADIATAAFANPAMLAYQRQNDDFSLLAGFGGFLNDNESAIDDIEAFQGASNNPEKLAILAKLNGKVIAPELSAAVAVGFAGRTYAMAISARQDVLATGTLQNYSPDPLNLNNPSFNIVDVRGVQTTEVAVSFARNYDFKGHKLSMGITPKLIAVETIAVSEPIATVNTGLSDLLDEQQSKDLGEFSTFDFGLTLGLTDHIHFGLVGQNLITEEVRFISVAGAPATLKFDSRWRAGAAYTDSYLTVGIDLDLMESDPIVTGGAFSALKTQRISVGAEINAFDIAQLRVGVMKNIASGLPADAGSPLYTFGAGIWLGFVLDVAVVAGEGNSLGVFAQTGFRF